MESVYDLLRNVVRGFYDQKFVIVFECILIHHVLSDRELVNASGIAIKDVRAICARLKDDHLLKEVSHRDESGFRAYTHTLYFVHFTEAIDAVKWKMYSIETKLREELNHRHNAQDYVCERCGKHYETIDALTLFDASMQQFVCEVCGSELCEHDPSDMAASDANNENKEQRGHMEEFMTQLKPVLMTLKMIDEMTIPDNNLESELRKQVPLMGFENTDVQAYNLPPHLAGSMAASQNQNDSGITIAGSANSRLPQQQQSTFQINITSEAEQQSQLAAMQLEKERLAEENALPEWHANSTVSTSIPSGNGESNKNREVLEPKTEAREEKSVSTSESAMDAYFKSLQAQQEANSTKEEGEEEDDDDDEFEDVM